MRGRGELIAAASGLVFAASTPPLDLQPGILLGLAGFAFGLFHGADGAESARVDPAALARRGFLFGLAANVLALRFVPDVIVRFTTLPLFVAWLALVLLAAAQALPWTAAGALASVLVRRCSTPRALAFAIAVLAATLVPAVFPWTPAGGLSRWPILLQTADVVGERGTSLLLALACALVAEAARARAWRPGALGAAAFGGLLAHGALRMDAVDAARAAAPQATIALLQPDFEALDRSEEHRAPAMMERLSTLTKQAEDEGAELTVWPESAYPYTLPYGIQASPRGSRAFFQHGAHGPVLAGAYLTKGAGVGTNSVLLVAKGGAIGASYDKRHLLWFGETIPLGDTFPVLRRVFARGTGLDAGTENIAFRTGAITASVLNCYEDTLPGAGREAMSVRPNLLVNVTNDAWFAETAESELHLRLAVLRAIEGRRDLVRAVNRGPASWVDAAGRIRARVVAAPGTGPSAPLLVTPALLDLPLGLYPRAGDAPILALAVLAVVAPGLAAARARRRRHKRAAGAVS